MDYIKVLIKPILLFIITILGVSFGNWFCIQFMARYCAPWSLLGPLINIMSLGSPVCQFINNIQIGLANYYITIWASAATTTVIWITSCLANLK